MSFICPDCGQNFGYDKEMFEYHRHKQHPHASFANQYEIERLSKENQKSREYEKTKFPEKGFPYLLEKLSKKKPRKTDGGAISPPEIEAFEKDGIPYTVNIFYGYYTAIISYKNSWELILIRPYASHGILGEWTRLVDCNSAAELWGKLENRWRKIV